MKVVTRTHKTQMNLTQSYFNRVTSGRLRLKCDGTRAETRFRLSAKRASQFKSVGGGVSSVDYRQPRCAQAVVMLGTPCSEVV